MLFFRLFILLLSSVILWSCGESRSTIHIGVSQCSEDEWRNAMNQAIKREALFYDDVHVEIRSVRDNTQLQRQDIRYFIDEGVDAIIVSPNEVDSLSGVIEEAIQKGIVVVEVDRVSGNNNVHAYIGADHVDIGRQAGRYVSQILKGKGNILVVRGMDNSTPAKERYQGMAEVLDKMPDIHIVGECAADWLQQPAQRLTDSLLRVHPNVDLILAQNDRMAKGCYLAAQALHRENQIKFVGIDATAGKGFGIDMVLKGILQATVIVPSGGDVAVETVMHILNHKPYRRVNLLPGSAVVDRANACLMEIQANHIAGQYRRIEQLNGRINQYLERVVTQEHLLFTTLVMMMFFCIMIFAFYRAYRMKKRFSDKLAKAYNDLEFTSKQLECATQEKLAFFTNVSHDLRTPLTLVVTSIDEMSNEKNTLSSKALYLLSLAHNNVNILLRLINDLLDFRRLENGKLQLHAHPFKLKEQVKIWAESFRIFALRKHIQYKVNIQDDVPELFVGDCERMERIFFNLVNNAFKFTPEHGKIVLVLSANNAFVNLDVIDSGCGMRPKDMDKIFDRFYKSSVHSSGSGIGLEVARAFARLHGGDVTVKSEYGKGSTFTASIPRNIPEDTTTDATAEYEPIKVLEYIDLEQDALMGSDDSEKPTLLVIDDNDDMRSYLKQMLAKYYHVEEANNGEEGLRLASKLIPDLVVCDVMMPVMDGNECCQRLKNDLNTSHIPVLLLTACSMEEQRIEGFNSGADAYVAKPFSPKLLLARIDNLLKNRNRIKTFFDDSPSMKNDVISQLDKDFASRLRHLIDENMSNSELNVEDLGKSIGLSRTQFYRKVKALTGFTPTELIRTARLKRAAYLLATTDMQVSEICYEVGFSSPSYFSKCYKDEFGKAPTSNRM